MELDGEVDGFVDFAVSSVGLASLLKRDGSL